MSFTAWFTSAGPDGVRHRLVEHLVISLEATAIAMVIAIPLGVVLGHFGRGGVLAVNVSNIGRAIPTYGVIVLLAVAPSPFGTTDLTVLVGLAVFALPTLLTNTYTGVVGVDDEVKEAARGMGLTGGQMIRRVELPLAFPLIAAGVRSALLQVIATAVLAGTIGQGGLGQLIVDGLGSQDKNEIYAGALTVAALAFLADQLLGLVESRLSPVRRADRAGRRAVRAAPAPEGDAVIAR